MPAWENNKITYRFEINNNEATIYSIKGQSGVELKKIQIPSYVQYNGMDYPVVEIRGGEYKDVPVEKYVDDKRRKDYGTYVKTGEYKSRTASVFSYYTQNSFEDSIESIVLPKTIKRLGKYAFVSCSKLKSVKLNNGLEIIGERAFENCFNLKDLTIPSSVKKICSLAFCGTTSIYLQIQNKPGSIEFEESALGSNDSVKYVGTSFLSRLLK